MVSWRYPDLFKLNSQSFLILKLALFNSLVQLPFVCLLFFGGMVIHIIITIITIIFVFRTTPAAYGSSQAKGQIGAIAAGLYCSHSNARSEPCLGTTPQLTAMPDP